MKVTFIYYVRDGENKIRGEMTIKIVSFFQDAYIDLIGLNENQKIIKRRLELFRPFLKTPSPTDVYTELLRMVESRKIRINKNST